MRRKFKEIATRIDLSGSRMMAEPRVYLDYNASAPVLPAARAAMLAAMDVTGNASSVHGEGRALRRIVEGARADVAALVGGKPEHVVFTSGATEAASTLLTSDWRMGRSPLRMGHLYVSAADHPCILSGGRFAAEAVTRIGVDGNGVIDLTALESALAAHDRDSGLPLVAVHAANNETGVVQPIAGIAEIVKAAGGVLVVDAVQAAGRVSLDMTGACGDFLILSAHKIGGPKGVGAFVGKADLMMPMPLVRGGGQERGFRAGTENVVGIAGFAAAARYAAAVERTASLIGKRGRIEAVIREIAPDAEIYGEKVGRLANTIFFAIPGVKAETAQIAFDLAGIAVSAGSACSSGKVGPSHVLKAMGVMRPEGGLRVSIGEETSLAEIDRFAAALARIAARRSADSKAA